MKVLPLGSYRFSSCAPARRARSPRGRRRAGPRSRTGRAGCQEPPRAGRRGAGGGGGLRSRGVVSRVGTWASPIRSRDKTELGSPGRGRGGQAGPSGIRAPSSGGAARDCTAGGATFVSQPRPREEQVPGETESTHQYRSRSCRARAGRARRWRRVFLGGWAGSRTRCQGPQVPGAFPEPRASRGWCSSWACGHRGRGLRKETPRSRAPTGPSLLGTVRGASLREGEVLCLPRRQGPEGAWPGPLHGRGQDPHFAGEDTEAWELESLAAEQRQDGNQVWL